MGSPTVAVAPSSTAVPVDDARVPPDFAATCEVPRPAVRRAPDLWARCFASGTKPLDLGPKLRRYIELPSVREIWLIDSRERWVQVWQRAEDTWIVTLAAARRGLFASEALGDRVDLDALYRNTGL